MTVEKGNIFIQTISVEKSFSKTVCKMLRKLDTKSSWKSMKTFEMKSFKRIIRKMFFLSVPYSVYRGP